MNNNPLAGGDQFLSHPVWVASAETKYGGRKDIREFSAKAININGFREFIFDHTFRDFNRTSFTIGVGCEIRDDTGHYRCIKSLSYQPFKKIYPRLITERIS